MKITIKGYLKGAKKAQTKKGKEIYNLVLGDKENFDKVFLKGASDFKFEDYKNQDVVLYANLSQHPKYGESVFVFGADIAND